jgi:RNA polymerase sigma-70 factor (ECF subfamily)
MSDDNEIIQNILDGDIDLFGKLLDRHQRKVFGIVARRVPECDREAVAQDVFVDCFKSLEKFDRSKPFENWLSTIAVRRCHDYWRKKGASANLEGEWRDEWIEAANDSASIEEFERKVRREDTLAVLNEALDALSPDDRLLVDMIYLEGMKLKDVADRLGLTLSNVKVKAMRARTKMRAAIENVTRK